MGAHIADLVLILDSGRPPEFRVQCEVILDWDAARTVQANLAEGGQSLKRVEDVVTRHIAPGASPTFREIIKLAFRDNYESPR